MSYVHLCVALSPDTRDFSGMPGDEADVCVHVHVHVRMYLVGFAKACPTDVKASSLEC